MIGGDDLNVWGISFLSSTAPLSRRQRQTYGASVYKGIFEFCVAFKKLLMKKHRVLHVFVESQMKRKRRRQMSQMKGLKMHHCFCNLDVANKVTR